MSVLDRLERRAALPATVADAGLAVVLALVLAYEAAFTARHHGSWPFDLAAGLLICAAALARRRSCAVAVAAGLTVAGAAELAAWLWHLPAQPDAAADLALLVLIGSAARRLPPRQVAVVAAAAAVVVAGTIERYLVFISAGVPASYAATWLTGLGSVAALGTGFWLRLLDGRRMATLEAVRQAERLELARELHDAAAHHITSIVIQAQAARLAANQQPGHQPGQLPGRLADALADALAGIETAGADALGSLRRVIGLLRDAGDDDASGVAPGPGELSELVSRFAARVPGGPDVRLQLPDGPPGTAWPPELTATVYRVVQEALTNVARHAAGARSVTVTVAHDQRAVTVRVTDDGRGDGAARFPHASGYGLVGMRERVERLGGELIAGPGAGPGDWPGEGPGTGSGRAAGWSVVAILPLPGAAAAGAARIARAGMAGAQAGTGIAGTGTTRAGVGSGAGTAGAAAPGRA
jgi:signal transduction histidine kinase